MAPLPPNNTARFRVHYSNAGQDHTLQLRSTNSPAQIGAFVNALFTAAGTLLYTTTIKFTDWAPAGSDIFNLVTAGNEGAVFTGAGAAPDAAAGARTAGFVGRTSGGRRVRIFLFGTTSIGNDYRWLAGESAAVDAVLGQLVFAGANVLGIDGLQPTWRSYANANVNDHWVKEIRP